MKDRYTIVRNNGISADIGTLSEGEQTFIAFLYYYHKVQGVDSNHTGHQETLCVIDDPISSLDSEVLFIIGSLIKKLISQCIDNEGQVKQLIIFTHNVYFHKEITYVRNNERNSSRKFYTIRKNIEIPNTIESHINNPIRTSYQVLWNEVKNAETHHISIVLIQNIMRRILETYFTTMGSIKMEELLDNFETSAEKTLCNTMFSWINEGSHVIFEEIEFSNTQFTIENYLSIFKEIFIKSGHEGHYNMMMGIDS